MQRKTHTRAAVKVLEVIQADQWEQRHDEDQHPHRAHHDGRFFQTEAFEFEREDYANEPVEGYDGESKDRQLAGEGGDEAGEATQVAFLPELVVDDVDAAVVGVDDGDDHQIHAHKEVADGEVGNQE